MGSLVGSGGMSGGSGVCQHVYQHNNAMTMWKTLRKKHPVNVMGKIHTHIHTG